MQRMHNRTLPASQPSAATTIDHAQRHPLRSRPDARRHLPRTLRGRLLRPADRRAPRRCHQFRQVSGGVVGEHRLRLRAARTEGGADFARRRRRQRPFPGGDHRPRRLRREPRQHRSATAHRRRRARDQGQGHVSADLHARELRRHGDHRRRRRRSLHRQEPCVAHHRHALFDRVHQPHQQPRAGPRAQERRAHRARHRLSTRAVGTDRARRRRDALRSLRHGDRAPAAHPPQDRPGDRYHRGVQHCRRQHRHHGIAACGARGEQGRAGGQARAAGLRGDRWRDSALARRCVQRQGGRSRGAQCARRGRCLLRRIPLRLGAR